MTGGFERSNCESHRFPTTHWTAVEQAGVSGEGSEEALARLLPRYVGPLRAHLVQHKRLPRQQADELLQAFMADTVLERNLVGGAVRERGRFRTFLLTALDRFVSNQLRHANRLKRSPRQPGTLLDLDAGATDVPSSEIPTPSGAFEAAWARQVLSNAAERMRDECRTSDRADVWQVFNARVLSPTLEGGEPESYDELVVRLGLRDPAAAANLLVTAKRMFARSLKGVVGEYMGEDGQLDQEIADLRDALARGRK